MPGVELPIEKDNANVACHICLKMFSSFYDAEVGAVAMYSSRCVFGANTTGGSVVFLFFLFLFSFQFCFYAFLDHLCRVNCTEHSSHSGYSNNKYIRKLCMYHLSLMYNNIGFLNTQ